MNEISGALSNGAKDALVELVTAFVESIPFTEPLAVIINRLLKSSYTPFSISRNYLLSELCQCALLAWLKPSTSRRMLDKNAYTKSWGYRLRIIILNFILFPVLTLFTDQITDLLIPVLYRRFGDIGGSISSLVVIIGYLTASAIPLAISYSFIFAICWAILSKLLPEMINALFIASICSAIYIATTSGTPEKLLWLLPILFAGLALSDWFFYSIQKYLVKRFVLKLP